MFQVKTDKQACLIEFMLEGLVHADEMTRFVDDLRKATLALSGQEIKILADLRRFRPSSPDVADMIRGVQEFGLRNGVKRVAELVESNTVALQLNRVARESGTHMILRRFADAQEARDWLITGAESMPRPRH